MVTCIIFILLNSTLINLSGFSVYPISLYLSLVAFKCDNPSDPLKKTAHFTSSYIADCCSFIQSLKIFGKLLLRAFKELNMNVRLASVIKIARFRKSQNNGRKVSAAGCDPAHFIGILNLYIERFVKFYGIKFEDIK